LRERIDPVFDPATPPEELQRLAGSPGFRESYVELHELRFVRLREWLHLTRPQPDAQPAPSFLAWELSAEDLRAALHGPPPLRTAP
jgi:hypothetical protein